jgi:hypothetical protein
MRFMKNSSRLELHPLEQRRARILALAKHAAVEVQPGQLAVEVPLVRIEIEFWRLDALLNGRSSGGFLGHRRFLGSWY